MKKKTLMMVTVLTLAISMIAITAIAAQTEYEAYEAFKSFIKEQDSNSDDAEGGKMKATINITDNDKEIMAMDVDFVGDKDAELAFGSVNLQTTEVDKSVDVFVSKDMVYLYDTLDDQYYLVEKDEEKYASYEEDSRFNKSERNHDLGLADERGEQIFDAFMEDYKDNFTLEENSDGSKVISFYMNRDDMSTLMKLLTSASLEERYDDSYDEVVIDSLLEKYPILVGMDQIKALMPDLVTDIQLEDINLNLYIDANDQPYGIDLGISISGLDVNNDFHTIGLSLTSAVEKDSDISISLPDMTNETVIVIDEADFPSHDYETRH